MRKERVKVGKFKETNISKMTLYIEKHKDSLTDDTWKWIESEIENMPFDKYVKSSVLGALMRSCLIAKHRQAMFQNNLLVLTWDVSND